MNTNLDSQQLTGVAFMSDYTHSSLLLTIVHCLILLERHLNEFLAPSKVWARSPVTSTGISPTCRLFCESGKNMSMKWIPYYAACK